VSGLPSYSKTRRTMPMMRRDVKGGDAEIPPRGISITIGSIHLYWINCGRWCLTTG
jgi:hypothetical protein